VFNHPYRIVGVENENLTEACQKIFSSFSYTNTGKKQQNYLSSWIKSTGHLLWFPSEQHVFLGITTLGTLVATDCRAFF
jgi:hypothetical protein